MITKSITLVSCCAKKASVTAPARDLYLSPLFKKSAEWADRQGEDWFVLSAHHGVIRPSREVVPYDLTLKSLRPCARQAWAKAVARDLEHMALVYGADHLNVTLLAGQQYGSWIPVAGDLCTVNQPMAGMQIGQRLQWLTRELRPAAQHLEAA